MRPLVSLILLALAPTLTNGQETTPELIVKGLKNPTSVAIQPKTGHVFVADSGHLKVIRVIDGKSEDVITDFPDGIYQNGKSYPAGPLAITFLDQNTLVVSSEPAPPSKPQLQLFNVPAAGADPIQSSDATSQMNLPDDKTPPNLGGFYDILKTTSAIFVPCQVSEQKGWIAKADLATGQLTNFNLAFPTQGVADAQIPFAAAMSPEGFLAVAQVGKPQSDTNSQLTFYDNQGKFLQSFNTQLTGVIGLAYGPQRGRLFVVDFNAKDDSMGGLYKIVADGKEACKSILIAELEKPTSLAFATNGDLYVTIFGGGTGEGEQPSGSLIKFTGLDQQPKKK